MSKNDIIDDDLRTAESMSVNDDVDVDNENDAAIAADQRTQYIASIDAKFQRDVAALMFGLFDSIRYYTKLTFIIIFVTALAHGVFVVLLALKLDGNSIFNWNVTLMPLTIYYGLWFIISVVGFASLPLFTLTADQYTYDLRTAINFSWLAAAFDRRIQFERTRLTSEFRKAIANMLPVQHIATWLNAYVETNLVGADAVLAQTLAAVERGDRLFQIRLAKQQELLKKLEKLANEGIDRVVGMRPDSPPAAHSATAPAATTTTDDDDDGDNDNDDKHDDKHAAPLGPAPSGPPRTTAAALARGVTLRSTAPPAIVVHDESTANTAPQVRAEPPPIERLKLPIGLRPAATTSATTDDVPEAPTPRSSMLDAVARLTDALSTRLHDVVVRADAAAATATTAPSHVDDAEPKSTDGGAVARHLLRAVRREVRRRARPAAAAAAQEAQPAGASLRASQMLDKVLSDLSASDAEPEAAALPSLKELAETLGNVDAATLEGVSKTLHAYVNDTAKQAKVAVESIVVDGADNDDESSETPPPATQEQQQQQQQQHDGGGDVVVVSAMPIKRRRRATTRSMGDFLRAMLVGGARDLFGAAEPGAADDGDGNNSAVGTTTAASIGEALKTARRAAVDSIAHAKEAVDGALPPESLLEAFVARGTKRDTQEKADIRRTAVKAMGKQALSQCAPELLALVSDTNNALTGVSNTLQAVTRVLRGAHETALFMAQMSHDVATAATPVEAVDRLGHWIRHQAMSHPAPDSLSMSVEERATQRRLLVRERTEMLSSHPRTDDDEDEDELRHVAQSRQQQQQEQQQQQKQSPIPIRVVPTGRDTPLAPRRRPRRVRAVSPLVFSHEPNLQGSGNNNNDDDDEEEDDVARTATNPRQRRNRKRSQRRHKRQHQQIG
jgi:hypothetical protein